MTNYACDLCGWASDDRGAVLAHVQSAHGVADPVEVGQLEQGGGLLYLRDGDGETVIDLAETVASLLARDQDAPCPHPTDRLYAWLARDDRAAGGVVLCVACSDCGAVLAGGADQ